MSSSGVTRPSGLFRADHRQLHPGPAVPRGCNCRTLVLPTEPYLPASRDWNTCRGGEERLHVQGRTQTQSCSEFPKTVAGKSSWVCDLVAWPQEGLGKEHFNTPGLKGHRFQEDDLMDLPHDTPLIFPGFVHSPQRCQMAHSCASQKAHPAVPAHSVPRKL